MKPTDWRRDSSPPSVIVEATLVWHGDSFILSSLTVGFSRRTPTRSHTGFWRQTKKENILWQGAGSLWMQMSLGKFTEQLAGSEAPASVTSPPTRHSPRFAKRSKGLQGPYSKNRHTHGKGHGNPVADAHCHWWLLFHGNDKLTVFTCYPQNGWWVF